MYIYIVRQVLVENRTITMLSVKFKLKKGEVICMLAGCTKHRSTK